MSEEARLSAMCADHEDCGGCQAAADWNDERLEALRELAQHLRMCRECGKTDVLRCFNGRSLWEAVFGVAP